MEPCSDFLNDDSFWKIIVDVCKFVSSLQAVEPGRMEPLNEVAKSHTIANFI